MQVLFLPGTCISDLLSLSRTGESVFVYQLGSLSTCVELTNLNPAKKGREAISYKTFILITASGRAGFRAGSGNLALKFYFF